MWGVIDLYRDMEVSSEAQVTSRQDPKDVFDKSHILNECCFA